MRTKLIAEIGINHNGSVEIAKKLIDVAAFCGCDYVKFQKRNPDICVPAAQKLEKRNTPWGELSYIDYKWRLEFGAKEYDEIDRHCEQMKMKWFASVWDEDSAEFMSRYCDICKIPSAMLSNTDLLAFSRGKFDMRLISTGMSDETQIETAVETFDPQVIFHTNSSYPSPVTELNLGYIRWLIEKYPGRKIGYSGHEFGLNTTYAAVGMGATWVERHITLDRTMWGSDQMASVEPIGFLKMVKTFRDMEAAMAGGYGPRTVFPSEQAKLKSLRPK